ncbi:Serine/threonine-protein kinase LATS2 [Manis javanica]|nr:Serine/threonine-protein kinase LATS2 [Manis javanica]
MQGTPLGSLEHSACSPQPCNISVSYFMDECTVGFGDYATAARHHPSPTLRTVSDRSGRAGPLDLRQPWRGPCRGPSRKWTDARPRKRRERRVDGGN